MDTVTLREQDHELSLTLPSGVRQRLGYKAGDELTLVEVEDGLKLVRHDAELELQLRLADEVLSEQAETLRELARR